MSNREENRFWFELLEILSWMPCVHRHNYVPNTWVNKV